LDIAISKGRQWHDQQVIHGAMFTLPDDCGSREDDGQHGHVVDDTHHGREPGRRDVRIERDPNVEIDRRQLYSLRMGEKIRHLGGDDLLGIAGPEAGLHHRGRIDVDLDRRLAPRKHILFEVGRDIDDEGVFSLVHQGHDILLDDLLRRLEVRRQERMGYAAREFRIVLIDECDRGVMQFLGIAPRLHDDRQRKRIDHKSQKHEIVQETPQFLDSEPEYVFSLAHRPSAPVSAT
jgi:hypothetical protein